MTNTAEAPAPEGRRSEPAATAFTVRKAAVLGAGTMGAAIAAHLTNAGIQTLLLDVAPSELTPAETAAGLTLDSRSRRCGRG